MNEKEILDMEPTLVNAIPYNRFRIFPLILELVPFLIGIIGWLMFKSSMNAGSELLTVGFTTLSMIYVCFSWYLFKGLKYSIWDVLAALFFGVGLAVVLLGLLFHLQEWEFSEQMVIAGDCTLILCLGLSILLIGIKKLVQPTSSEYEFTMSKKIFSRFLFYKVLYTIFGMNAYLINLFLI